MNKKDLPMGEVENKSPQIDFSNLNPKTLRVFLIFSKESDL